MVKIVGYNTTWEVNILLLVYGIAIALYFDLITYVRIFFVFFWIKILPKSFFSFDLDKEKEAFFNMLAIQSFFFFIGLRFLILSEPYLFATFNFILTYWLITNKFLITSSIIGIILAIFFLSDRSSKAFLEILSGIVVLEENEILKFNKTNLIFIGLLIVRRLYQEESMIRLWSI